MIVKRGIRCGPKLRRQQHQHKTRDALRSATKDERIFTSIWDCMTTMHDEIYRKSQSFSQLTRRMDHDARTKSRSSTLVTILSQSQRERYANPSHLLTLDQNKQTGPLWQTSGYQEPKKRLANLHNHKKHKQVSDIRFRKRDHKNLTLHYKSTWND